jgi:hypothetical protein
MNIDELKLICQGQAERNILEASMKTYLSKCKVMIDILANNVNLKDMALESEDGNLIKHTGLASKLWKLKLPMSPDVAKYLFASISVDDTVTIHCPKKVENRSEM